jgi:hypothetical protein
MTDAPETRTADPGWLVWRPGPSRPACEPHPYNHDHPAVSDFAQNARVTAQAARNSDRKITYGEGYEAVSPHAMDTLA